jgi:hypothetical protein
LIYRRVTSVYNRLSPPSSMPACNNAPTEFICPLTDHNGHARACDEQVRKQLWKGCHSEPYW